MAVQMIDPRQVRRIRLQLGYIQAALASAAGVSQSIVAEVEGGAVDPTFKTLRAISNALNSRIATTGKKREMSCPRP